MTPDIVLKWVKQEEEVEGDRTCFFADFGVYRLWVEPKEDSWWEIQLTDRQSEAVLTNKHVASSALENVERYAVEFASNYFRSMADALLPRGAKGEIRFKSIISVASGVVGLSEDGLVYEYSRNQWVLLSSAPLMKAGE